jgi:hypothetical protein
MYVPCLTRSNATFPLSNDTTSIGYFAACGDTDYCISHDPMNFCHNVCDSKDVSFRCPSGTRQSLIFEYAQLNIAITFCQE